MSLIITCIVYNYNFCARSVNEWHFPIILFWIVQLFLEYAFHTEPYSASQEISKTFEEEDLCNLGALQMMLPAHVYIMVQKKSPYKEFLDWR